MKLGSLLLAACLLLPASTMTAQSGGAPSDPISGTWTGTMGPDEATRMPITVKLKFDGKTAVSGTITGPPQPGEIKTGSFDPRTGALKLEVIVQGEGRTAVFEGTVVQGSASGRVLLDNQTGTFKMTKGTGEPAPAPPPGGSDALSALRRSFDEVSGYVTKAAALVPADKYAYRPAQSVRTFGQLIGHIADSYKYYCARAVGRDTQWSDAIEKGSTDKATLALKLQQSLDSCSSAYGGAGKVGALIDNVGHTNLHYGNSITYMRMLGLAPPSS